MKIGIIHHSFDVIGGAEKTTLNLIDALCQTNHSVTLYTTSKLVQIPDKIRINKILRFHFPSFWRIQRMIENEILFNSARNEDLIIVMSGGLSISDLKNKDILQKKEIFVLKLERLLLQDNKLQSLYLLQQI